MPARQAGKMPVSPVQAESCAGKAGDPCGVYVCLISDSNSTQSTSRRERRALLFPYPLAVMAQGSLIPDQRDVPEWVGEATLSVLAEEAGVSFLECGGRRNPTLWEDSGRRRFGRATPCQNRPLAAGRYSTGESGVARNPGKTPDSFCRRTTTEA